MTTTYNKLLQSIFAPALKTAGFKKTGPTWRKTVSNYTQVFNIQGSQWGPSFYLNIGIYIKSEGSKEAPNEYDCHLRGRVESASNSELLQLLNFDNEIPLNTRKIGLLDALHHIAIPRLDACSSLEGMIAAISSREIPQWAASKEAFSHTGLNPHA